MADKEGGSLETQGEEASKDANVTVDEPTAPALDTEPDPNTEWEKAAADSSGNDDGGSEDDSDGQDDSNEDEDDSGQS